LILDCGAAPEAKLVTLESWLKTIHSGHPDEKVIVSVNTRIQLNPSSPT
jgi:hypothetical protein